MYGEVVKTNFKTLIRLIKVFPFLPFASFTGRRFFLYIGNLSHFLNKVLSDQSIRNFDVLNIADRSSFTLCKVVKLFAQYSGRFIFLFPFPTIYIKLLLTLLGKMEVYDKINVHFELSIHKIQKDYNWLPLYEFPQGLYDKKN